ncbi:hypothetical protein CAP50_12385 [Psychrobacter sp. L7]|uniref:hypothetical protein n=1 Tax=Psychrobacter sp. L7 TaxID=1982756 RepID=UPI000C2A8E5B|nr:hypothetical protein [Psychrobacter sp. L7]PJX20251.1 hypothetical protein CAP50_12385 [Psychrobacter sp. L7]
MALDRNLEIKAIYNNGKPAQYEKVVIAYQTKSGIKEKTFTSNADGNIKTGIKISKLSPKNTFFYYDGGQGYPKVLNQDTQSIGHIHLLKVSSENPLSFLILYEYFDKDGSTKGDWISELDYKIYNKGKVIKIGKTDENGMTAPFQGIKDQGYQIKIKPKGASSYLNAKVRKKYQGTQSSIIKHDGKTSSYAVCLETFVGFKVVNNKNKGIPNVKVWLIDENGEKKGAVRTTDKHGRIAPFIQNFVRSVKVSLAGCELTLKEKEIVIPKHQGEDPYHVIEIKTMMCSTVPDKPDIEAMLGSKSKLPIVYDLAKKELLILKPKDFKQFDEISAELGKLVQMTYQQRARLEGAYQQGRSIKEIQDIEDALGIAEDAVKEKLNSSFATKSDLKEVFLVERYAGNDRGRGNTRLVRRYLENDAYLRYRNNRINQTDYSISLETGSGVGISASPESLDVAGLVDSIKNISLSVEKEWESEQYSKDLDLRFLSDSLISSANELSRSIQISESLDVDATAQWLRAVGGASASGSAEWNPKEGDIELSGGFDVSGKLVLCEGNIETRMAIPSKDGWRLHAKFEAAGEIDLGAIRFIVSCDFYGFTGVKASIAGSASINFEGGSQKLVAASRAPRQTAANMWDAANKQRKFDVERSYEPVEVMDANSNTKADIGITAFAGAEVGVTPAGSIEWLNPEVKDFRSFAKVSGTIAGSAGVGFSGSFYIFYQGGKFKVRAQAALCFGLGGKGGMEFEIDSALIAEFMRWLSYQLLHAGFRTLVYIQGAAFAAISQLSVLMLGQNSQVTQSLQEITDDFDNFLTYIDTDKARIELAQRIISKRDDDWLKYATPEAKGMLLYQLTRHAKVSHIEDLPTASVRSTIPIDIDLDLLEFRKQAIIIIFATVTTSPEWRNTLQHMTVNGAKGSLGKNEGDIIRLLNYGVGLADEAAVLAMINSNSTAKSNTGSYYVDAYITMRQKVKPSYPKGIEVVKNTDANYDIYSKMGDYTSPTFYAAANPDQYDQSVFDGYRDAAPIQRNDDDTYNV